MKNVPLLVAMCYYFVCFQLDIVLYALVNWFWMAYNVRMKVK